MSQILNNDLMKPGRAEVTSLRILRFQDSFSAPWQNILDPMFNKYK